MLSVADGVSVVTENLFVGRFRYVDELVRLGAQITTEGHHAMIRGVDQLSGTRCARATSAPRPRWSSPDSSPRARRRSTGLEHVERGYDDFVGRLAASARASSRRRDPRRPRRAARVRRATGRAARWRGCSPTSSRAASAQRAHRAPSPTPPPAPYVVGVTGPPGAGKSTLTDRLIAAVLEASPAGDAVAEVGVLCVDPSSPFTGGAILGDRIRMQGHATDPRVYIRSMATRGHLGGLSLAVPDAVARPRRAWGSPGPSSRPSASASSRSTSPSTADTTVVVTNPGWGDSMQANKAGLLEVADVFVINKADRAGVAETRRDLEQMLDLGGARAVAPADRRDVATTGEGDRRARRTRSWTHRDHVAATASGERALARARAGAGPRARGDAALARRGASPAAPPTRSRSTRCSPAGPTPTARPRRYWAPP